MLNCCINFLIYVIGFSFSLSTLPTIFEFLIVLSSIMIMMLCGPLRFSHIFYLSTTFFLSFYFRFVSHFNMPPNNRPHIRMRNKQNIKNKKKSKKDKCSLINAFSAFFSFFPIYFMYQVNSKAWNNKIVLIISLNKKKKKSYCKMK